jgi:hypothetical protein
MDTTAVTPPESKASWFPLAIVMLCQIQVSFNAFNVSIEGIVEDLGIPATSVGLALTTSTFAKGARDRNCLGAQGQAVAGVFDITTTKNFSRASDNACTNFKFRVGRMRIFSRNNCQLKCFLNRCGYGFH